MVHRGSRNYGQVWLDTCRLGCQWRGRNRDTGPRWWVFFNTWCWKRSLVCHKNSKELPSLKIKIRGFRAGEGKEKSLASAIPQDENDRDSEPNEKMATMTPRTSVTSLMNRAMTRRIFRNSTTTRTPWFSLRNSLSLPETILKRRRHDDMSRMLKASHWQSRKKGGTCF